MEENILKKYFRYSRDERQSITIVLTTCVILTLIPRSFPLFFQPTTTDFSDFQTEVQQFYAQSTESNKLTWNTRNSTNKTPPEAKEDLFYFDPNTASISDFIRLGLSEKRANTIINYRNKGGKFKTPKDLSKIYGIEKDYARLAPFISIKSESNKTKKQLQYNEKQQAKLFNFDPNTATKSDFQKLGLSGRTAQSIINYRNAGAQFHKKEDLKKVYTLPPADYERLEAYIEITPQETSEKKATLTPDIALQAAPKEQKELVTKAIPIKIDINTADIEAWKQLPGIGPGYANRIISFREKLGGFSSIEQIASTYHLPDSVFQNIRTYLVKSPIYKKVKINQVTAEILKSHPYINWKAANRIIAYRDQHGAFRDEAAFRKLHAFEAGFFDRIAPYLDFE